MSQKKRVAVLISGRGSNMAALISAAQAPDYPAAITLVLSDNSGAAGLAYATAQGVRAVTVERSRFTDRAVFEAAVGRELHQAGIELICLAGFMRLLSADFVERWRDRLINIHPSLLPAFRGLDTHARALAAGVKLHGCTVHFVRAEVDAGPIVAQAAVPVLAHDTVESLAARTLTAEHRLYPAALREIAGERVRIEGDIVRLDTPHAAPPPLLWPLAGEAG
ncbi:MAG: phosphoribosylglycinamide formyltransferase [Bauldia sp.]